MGKESYGILKGACIDEEQVSFLPIVLTNIRILDKISVYNVSANYIGGDDKVEELRGSELLKAAVQSKPSYAEAEKRTALKYGLYVAMTACVSMTMLEIIMKNSVNYGMFTVLFIIAGIASFYEGKKSFARVKCALGIIELVVALISVFLFMGELLI